MDTIESHQLEIAFNGLFLGDRKQLIKIQRKIINNSDEDEWEEIRQEWRLQLENYRKMITRFGLTEDEVFKIQLYRSFLWQLPSYEDAKKMYV